MNLRLFTALVLAGACLTQVAHAQPAPPPAGGPAGDKGAPAAAPGDAALKIAQSAFDEGQVAFLSGDFDKAADSFKKAYDARPFPQFPTSQAQDEGLGSSHSRTELHRTAVLLKRTFRCWADVQDCYDHDGDPPGSNTTMGRPLEQRNQC